METVPYNQLPLEVKFERYGGGEARLVKVLKSEISNSDLDRIVEICNQKPVYDILTHLFATGEDGSYTHEDAEGFVANGDQNWQENTQVAYFIRDSNDQIVGSVGIHEKDENGAAEIGYWADTNEGAGGYVTNAVEEICKIAPNWGYKKLYGRVLPDNTASIGVLTRAGFVEDTELGLVTISREFGDRKETKEVLIYNKQLE